MASKEYVGSTDLLVIFNLIKTELAKYVLAVSGKGLSANDFTNELKTKLEGITFENVLSTSSTNGVQNGTVATALNLKADIASPTFTGTPAAPTASAGTNTTQIATTAFVTAAIATAMSTVTSIRFDAGQDGTGYASLTALRTAHPTGENGVIYLVQNAGGSPNTKDEYFWNTSSSDYELFGTTAIDLSNYLQTTDVVEIASSDVTAAWNSVFGS